MEKVLNLEKSVYDLVHEYPEAETIMKNLGFEAIGNPAMLNTAGRFMTIKKGAAMKRIPLERIIQVFREQGFEIKE